MIDGQTAGFIAILVLCGAVYVLRRRGLLRASVNLPRMNRKRLMQSVERVPLGNQHSLHLVKVADRHILVAVSPSGCSLLDNVLIPMSDDAPEPVQ